LERTTKSLVLIRAKHLAESVTTPMLLLDAEGNVVYFNEAAESALGLRYTEVGQIPVSEWQERFKVRARDGSPFTLDTMPGWGDVRNERPGTGHVRLTTADGREPLLAVCAVPLFTSQDQLDGALVLFWEEG
jgi:PAS domain S-box-containing protein